MANVADLDTQLDASIDANELEGLASQLEEFVFGRDSECSKTILTDLHRIIFGPVGDQLTSLVKRYQLKLLAVSKAGTINGSLLNVPLSYLTSDWENYVRNKGDQWRNWTKGSEARPPVPIVLQAGDLRWVTNSYIYFDVNVVGAIYDTLLNLYHASHKIKCPWDETITHEADGWWRIVELDYQLKIEFVNGYDRSKEKPAWNAKPSYEKLERCGGLVHEPDYKNGICHTVVSLPRRIS